MVLAWTLYNIFPTVIYYSKPLNRPVDKTEAEAIEKRVASRVNSLEDDALEWMRAFCSMLGVKPTALAIDPKDPGLITLKVATDRDLSRVKKFLPRAGMQIVFKPSQLYMGEVSDKSVQIVRRVGIRLNERNLSQYFRFLKKRDEMGKPTDTYFAIARDRFVEVAYACAGPSFLAKQVDAALKSGDQQALEHLSAFLYEWQNSFEPNSAIQKRLLNTLFQGPDAHSTLERTATEFFQESKRLQQEADSLEDAEGVEEKRRRATLLSERYEKISTWLRTEKETVKNVPTLTREELYARANESREKRAKQRQGIILENHPFIQFISLDWTQDSLVLDLHHDVVEILDSLDNSSEAAARRRDAVNKIVMNEMGWLSRESNERFEDKKSSFEAALSKSPRSNSLIALSMPALASELSNSLLEEIKSEWQPESIDLQEDVYPRFGIKEYQAAPSEVKNLSLLLFSPSQSREGPEQLRPGSLYLVLRGAMRLLKEDETIQGDIEQLVRILQQRGFVHYSGEVFGATSPFANDIFFELDRFYEPVLEATREEFFVPGIAKVALLECGTCEDRILAENRIDDQMQEELIKWREAWQAAQVSLDPMDHFTVPKPTKSIFWSNLKRSWRKYWRGDESRIVRWGLDLSGGKSVRIGLVDQAGDPRE
jgi:SecD/SecF fusion protein